MPNARSVVLEISSGLRNFDLPSDDVTLKISPYQSVDWKADAFVKELDFVVVGNVGQNVGSYSLPAGTEEAILSAPVRVYNGRSQLRFWWSKELEKTWSVTGIAFHVESKSLNAKASLYFSLN